MLPLIHFIDFEGSRQSGILEYGVVTLYGGKIEATRTRLCRATGTISDRDRQQHGISEANVSEEAPFESDWDLFASLRESGPLGAHHAAIEDGLIRMIWPYPRNSPDFTEERSNLTSWGPWIDTLQIYRQLYPDLDNYKLGYLIEHFDLTESLDDHARRNCPPKRKSYHCALYDTLASALLFLRLIQEPALEGVSLRWLLQQSAPSQIKRDSMGQQELF